jgi:very-short-patch-repair endonuclease
VDDSLRSKFEKKYELWKQRLLDISAGNRLLNFRPTKVSTIQITSPEVTDLFQRIALSERSLRFPLYEGKTILSLSDESSEEVPPELYKVRPGEIETPKSPPELEKSLYRLTTLSRVSKEERGVNTLYLALGMLEWRPADQAAIQRAPLLLVPVDLAREDRLHPYLLAPFDEDPEVNRTLIYMLKQDFDFALPEFPAEASTDALSDFFRRVGKAVSPKGWRVLSEAWLAQFQFKKLAMHKDLADHQDGAHENSRLVGVAGLGAFEEPPAIGSEDTFDEVRPSEVFTVLDADSSQFGALLRARAGQDLVIEGPPGTGKSQTITNLIAQSLLEGKKVLFVSEKRAALDVVHGRLQDVGLGPFCLEIHSDKANKRDVIMRIGASLQARKPNPGRQARMQSDTLLALRRELNEYVRTLHKPVLFDKSAFEVHGELGLLESVPTISAAVGVPISELNIEGELRLMRQARRLAQMPEMLVHYHEHPWFGCALNEWSLEQQTHLLAHLQRFRATLASFDALASRLAELMGTRPASCLDALDEFVDLASLFAASPCPPRSWLLDAPLDELGESARQFAQRQARHRELRERLLQHYTARLFDQNCADLSDALNPRGPHMLTALKKSADPYVALAQDGSIIAGRLTEAIEAVGLLTEAARELATAVGEPVPMGVPDTARLARLAALAATDPRPHETWLSWEVVNGLVDEARDACRRRERLTSLRAELTEEFVEGFFELPLIQWRSEFEERFARVTRIFNGEYRRRLKTLRGVTKAGRRLRHRRAVAKIDQGAEVLEIEQWFTVRRPEHARTLGSHYKGLDTDWTATITRLETVRSILEVRRGEAPAAPLRAALLAGDQALRRIHELGTEIARQRERLARALKALAEHVDVTTLLGTRDHSEAALNTLRESLTIARQQIGRFLDSLQALDDVARPGSSRNPLEKAVDARDAHELSALEGELAAVRESLLETYGHLFNGIDTRWDEVILALDWAVRFRALSAKTDLGPDGLIAACTPQRVDAARSASGELQSFAAQVREENTYLVGVFDVEAIRPGGARLHAASFATLLAWLDARITHIGELSDWIQFQALRRECDQSGLADFVTKALEERLRADALEQALRKRLLILQLDEIYRRAPRLRDFQWRDHEDVVLRFKNLDHDLMATHAELVRSSIMERQPNLSGPAVGQFGFLRRELAKQRRHAPLRKLFEQSGSVIVASTPCLLMSPLSVATYLPKDSVQFDLVIFDEASQMPAEDAAGAVLRGKQLIVAGDPKQLPPTRFFQRALEEDGDYADVEETLESVLDDCRAASMQRCTLEWHYRSRHESLIAFSNAEFYGNGLVTFPSPTAVPPEDCGIRFEYVADGVYDRGHSRTNRREAQRVAELVERHLDQWGNRRSLGVITFNISQEQAVNEEIERLAQKRPDLEQFLRRTGEEPFFVKPLETVQGDERDSIIITVGFGKDSTGTLALNFGPVNLEGGERRLNVAFTRARWELALVASIQAHDIDESRVQKSGPKVLKRYLAFAKEGCLPPETAAPTGESESPFEVAVWEALREHGLDVDRQVGVSQYRIDLAIRDAEQPGRYLLGVECDGATYHRAAVARDRDRLRQHVLEGLGWTIHRIWSTDWIRDRRGAMQRLLERLEQLRRGGSGSGSRGTRESDASGGDGGSFVRGRELNEAALAPLPIESATDPYLGYPAIGTYSETQGRRRDREQFYDGTDSNVWDDVIRVVSHEGPVHHDVVVVRVARMYKLHRTGSVVEQTVSAQVREAIKKGHIRRQGDFLWSWRMNQAKPRRPENGTALRRIEHVPPEELEGAALVVARLAAGVTAEELVPEIARVLGYLRTGAHVEKAARRAVARLIKAGALVERGGFLFPSEDTPT